MGTRNDGKDAARAVEAGSGTGDGASRTVSKVRSINSGLIGLS